jgi:hypothetical protein
MHTWTPRADEWALEVEPEDTVQTGNRAGRCDGGADLAARIADQSREASRCAIAPMRPRNGSHAVGRRLVVKENPAATIDLQIDKTGCQEDTRLKAHLRTTGRNLGPRPEPSDAAVFNEQRSLDMPVVTVKNAIGQNGVPISNCAIVLARIH